MIATGSGGGATAAPPRPDAPDGGKGPVASATADPPPRLAEGIELLGEYQGSGFKEPPFIARRMDGQMVQLPGLLYAVAEATDGRTGYDGIAEKVSARVGRDVSGDNVKFLADKKLRPLGILASPDGSSPQLEKPDPLLALRFRTAVIPARLVRSVTKVFGSLFFPVVVAVVLAGLVALDIWLFGVHGVAQSVRDVLYHPVLMLLVFGGIILSAAFHEIGHATACRYGGAEPGVMGVGIYIVWPAFYTDVTDAYRLGRGGRLRTDFGGVYFNVIFSLLTAGAYFLTGFEPLLLVVVLVQLEILQQFLPFLRLDGYYIVSDLTGVPDMFMRIKPILASLVPWKKSDQKVTELKPWARAAVTLWVFILVPVLLFNLTLIAISAPRIFGTIWDSLGNQAHSLAVAWGAGSVGLVALHVFEMVFLALPALGIAYTLVRVARRVSSKTWTWSKERPARRTVVVLAWAAIIGALAYTWWPNGDYEPIGPNERWTVQQGIAAIKQAPTGRAGVTLATAPTGSAVVAPIVPGVAPAPGASPTPQASASAGASPAASTVPAETAASPTTTASPAATSSPAASPTTSPVTTSSP